MNFADSFPLRKCTQTLINRKRTEEPNVFFYLFNLLHQLGQGHHNSICQLLWALLT
jgi:hypothetical protein